LLGQFLYINNIIFIFSRTFLDSLQITLGLTALLHFLELITNVAWDLDVGLNYLFGGEAK